METGVVYRLHELAMGLDAVRETLSQRWSAEESRRRDLERLGERGEKVRLVEAQQGGVCAGPGVPIGSLPSTICA